MSTAVDLRVLELICSRICHDLVSPVGAINNGVELIRELAEENTPSGIEGEALALIAHSAEQGSRRLRVLRLAYGAAGADAPWEEQRVALTQFFAGSRVTVVWPPERDAALPHGVRGFGKILVNVVLLAADALGQNGRITIEARPGGAAVVANGTAPALDVERSAALSGKTAAADLDPRSFHAYVTQRFAANYDVKLTVNPVATDRLDFVLTAG